MRITVDRYSCIGSGQCALALPEIFDQDSADGKVELLDDQPPPDLRDSVREAVGRCPVQAITLAG